MMFSQELSIAGTPKVYTRYESVSEKHSFCRSKRTHLISGRAKYCEKRQHLQ